MLFGLIQMKINGFLMRFGNKRIVFVLAGLGILSGCSSAPKMTKQPIQISIDTNSVVIEHIRSWVDRHAREARSLNAAGDITVLQGEESNSASFRTKSKRIDPAG